MKFLFHVLLLFVFTTSFAQKKHLNIDSTFQVLKVQINSSSKVNKLIDLYNKSIRQHEINEAIIQEALKDAEKIYDINSIAKCYNKMGVSARYNVDYPKSVTYHKRALSYLNQTTDTLEKIKCLNGLGTTYRKLNLEKEAFSYYFQALKFSNLINNKKSIAIALNGMGNVFINTEEYDKALYYFKKALIVEEVLKRKRGQRYDLANIGEAFMLKKEYDSAYIYYNRALSLTKKGRNAIEKTLLALLFQKKKDYAKSITYYQEAIKGLQAKKNKRYLSNSLINLGISQLGINKSSLAKSNIDKGLLIAKSIKSKENIMLGYNALVSYYTKQNNYKKALQSQQLATSFHDSIINVASKKSIISAQIAYETDKKDKKIQKLAVEKAANLSKAKRNYKRMLIATALGILGVVFLLTVLYLYRRNTDLEMQHKNVALQSYMLQIDELNSTIKSGSQLTNKELQATFEKYHLSKREEEVLALIGQGLSNDEIAKKMFVSKNTIKTHIKHIYEKLDVKNRVQAMKKIVV